MFLVFFYSDRCRSLWWSGPGAEDRHESPVRHEDTEKDGRPQAESGGCTGPAGFHWTEFEIWRFLHFFLLNFSFISVRIRPLIGFFICFPVAGGSRQGRTRYFGRSRQWVGSQAVLFVPGIADLLDGIAIDQEVKSFFFFSIHLQDKDNLYFVMDYIPGGDLMSLLIKLGIFEEPLARYGKILKFNCRGVK